MKALVKKEARPGLWLEDVPEPEIGINDVLIQVRTHGHLRHRPPHLQVGRVGAEDHSRADGRRPRVRRRDRRGRLQRQRFLTRATSSAARGTSSAAAAATAWPAGGICAPTRRGVGVNRPGRLRRIHLAADDQRLAPSTRRSTATSPRSSIRSATPCTPRCRSPCSGEDVLITGAGPIGIMAAAVVRHAGARYVVITDVNPYRLELAEEDGRHAGG